ncbi:unnamed protein product, partial [Sphagnum balticum]
SLAPLVRRITLTLTSPYKFEAPWNAWEFAYHILHKQANLVILSMAWLTLEDARSYSRSPKEPDMETLSYWLARLEPLIRAETEGEIIVVLCNRSGTEEEAVYTGTSAVLGIQSGEVKVYGILGRGEKELLVVDTNKRPQAKLISERNSSASNKRNKTATPMGKSTDSTATAKSDLRGNTKATGITIPDDVPQTMEEIITPLSPVDAASPSAFFAPKRHRPEGENLREILKSSIGRNDFQTVSPDSPTFVRPPSPKSRNTSRSRTPVQQTLAESPTLIRPASRNVSRTRTPADQATAGSPTFVRPASPKSRNASRSRTPAQKPALMAHDLAEEDEVTATALKFASPPHSSETLPDRCRSSFTVNAFGPRSAYKLPRPKSACW